MISSLIERTFTARENATRQPAVRLSLMAAAGLLVAFLWGMWSNLLPNYTESTLTRLAPAVTGDTNDLVVRGLDFLVALVALLALVLATDRAEIGLPVRQSAKQAGAVSIYYLAGQTYIVIIFAMRILVDPWLPVGASGFNPSAMSMQYQILVSVDAAKEEIVAVAVPVVIATRLLRAFSASPSTRHKLRWVGVVALTGVRLGYHWWQGTHEAQLVVWAAVAVVIFLRTRSLVAMMVGHVLMDWTNVSLLRPWVYVIVFGLFLYFLFDFVQGEGGAPENSGGGGTERSVGGRGRDYG
ncbi:hypothetical protein [Kutzneria sp. 744]|uniref:hypothetical protein n=1 Tax=Kutzneria sp. (strain 744) TaxID=345341 RepID=UPI0003EED103|nr:hypothetical protein [Kutzneria sp. 744]EWM19826.1 hypothetical protein KUTG_10130 [Kutzneria sp. 744]